jgi:arylsulfatase A-like enzyme
MKPNFLLLITDQQRADHLGCYGNRIVRTPHIDGIAEHGSRFSRFYVANPACMPNRATLMTGRMPSGHGVRTNGVPLSRRATTFVELLRAAGYQTASAGKIHLQPMHGDPPILKPVPTSGVEPPAALRDAWHADPPEWSYDQERLNLWKNDPGHDVQLPYYGFEKVALTLMHADEAHGHYGRWLQAQSGDADALIGPENALAKGDFSALQAWRTAVPEELYSTSYIRDRAKNYLAEAAAADRPFFLQVSFNDPHHPFTPPGRYWDMYKPDDMPLPRAYRPNIGEPPPPLKHLLAERDEGRANRKSWMFQAVGERDVKEAMALTYGSITMIDDAIGDILSELRRLSLDQNTVVIFTSDHGEMMGDHQLMFKGPMHYQGVIRAPFIWREPAGGSQPQRITPDMAGTIDIAPTILARAGVAPNHGMHGTSLLPVLKGEAGRRKAMLVEEESQRTFLGFDRPVRLRTLVTPDWRMTIYRGADWGELYDLRNDPDELENLWDCARHQSIRSDLLFDLIQSMQEFSDDSPLPTARV